MIKLTSTLFFATLIIACNSHDKKEESPGSKESTRQAKSPVNCYRYATNSDTVNLKLIHVGKSITGTLVYNLKEKDKNIGTIQGSMRGNVLIADYTFMSEGVQSVRQVAFKLEGNSFVEGYGESYDSAGKMIFKNVDSLAFGSDLKLAEIDCQ